MDQFREFQWAKAFVRLYNRENKTNYKVIKAEEENDSADVYLQAEGFPDQPVQIVRMTNTESMQAHTALIRFHRRLRQKVVSIVPEMFEVTVDLKRDIHPKEIEGHIEKIGDKLMHLKGDPFTEPKVFALDSSAVKNVTFEKSEIWMQSNVHVLAPDKKFDLKKLVDEVIQKKRGKNYSDQSNLWLLIVEYDDPYSIIDFERSGLIGIKNGINDFARIFYVSPTGPREFYRELS